MTSPDQVLLSHILQSGAVASVHVKGGTAIKAAPATYFVSLVSAALTWPRLS